MFTTQRQHGFAAISAIFLIVVVGALGAVMLTVSNTQQLTSAKDVQGTRAYWAAQGGLEWAIASVVVSPPADAATTSLVVCPTSPRPERLDGFALVVSCTALTYVEADGNVNILQLTSIASTPGNTPGSLGYVERSVSAAIER